MKRPDRAADRARGRAEALAAMGRHQDEPLGWVELDADRLAAPAASKSASITGLPVTWIDADGTPSRKRLSRAAIVGAK